jgi:hypothetical protein
MGRHPPEGVIGMLIALISDHRARTVFMILALMGAVLLASCGSDGGMYQGGNDDSPHWR